MGVRSPDRSVEHHATLGETVRPGTASADREKARLSQRDITRVRAPGEISRDQSSQGGFSQPGLAVPGRAPADSYHSADPLELSESGAGTDQTLRGAREDLATS